MGQVCEKHNEFYETACRWCEPALGLNAVLPVQILFGIVGRRLADKIRKDNALLGKLKAEEPDLSESTLDRHGGCE